MTNEDIEHALSRRKRIVHTPDLVGLLTFLVGFAIIGVFVIIDLFIWITLEFKGFDMTYVLIPQVILGYIAALVFMINHTTYYIKHARELTIKDKLKLIWIDTKIGAKENFGCTLIFGYILFFLILPLAISSIAHEHGYETISKVATYVFFGGLAFAIWVLMKVGIIK